MRVVHGKKCTEVGIFVPTSGVIDVTCGVCGMWGVWDVGCVVCGMWDYPVGLPVKIITSPNSSDSTFNSPVSWSCKVWVDVCGVGHENDTCVSLCVCDLPVLSIDFL